MPAGLLPVMLVSVPGSARRGCAMTAPLWPCWKCGGAGSRNLLRLGYCSTHLAELFAGFDPAIWSMHGVGLPCGALRPEHGPAVEDLRCVACGATWVGLAGEPCTWCQRSRDVLVAHEHDMVLRVPEQANERTLTTWGERLRRAVDTQIITRAEAERAWRRAVHHVAA